MKRFAIALALLPACYGVSYALWIQLKSFRHVPEGSFYFLAGMFSYLAFQWIFFQPIRTYVFGHELTHALAAWMTGGKVKHFHVSKKGGSVTVSKSNFWISLSPYIVPIYTIALLGLFFSIDYFYPVQRYWRPFLWVLGLSMGFHVALTVYALKMDQPDLKTSGRFLSGVIIYLGNAASVVFLLGILFPRTVSWKSFARVSGEKTFYALRQVGQGGVYVYQGARRGISDRN